MKTIQDEVASALAAHKEACDRLKAARLRNNIPLCDDTRRADERNAAFALVSKAEREVEQSQGGALALVEKLDPMTREAALKQVDAAAAASRIR